MKNYLEVTAPKGMTSPELDELNQLITLTQYNVPLPEEIDRIRSYLTRFPDLLQQLGDLSALSLQNIAGYAAADRITREAIEISADKLRAELSRPGDTTLEKFAIDQCVHAHILHYTVELRYVNAHGANPTAARSLYWEKRLDNSQKRFLRTLDNLARLRRFAIPPIQINIAETQTNISTSTSPAPPTHSEFLDASS